MKSNIQDQGQPQSGEALPALPEDCREEMREMAGTHYFCRVVNLTHTAIIEIPKTAEGTVRGMTAEMYHGATIYAAGAVSPLAGCREVVAVPTPEWKGKK